MIEVVLCRTLFLEVRCSFNGQGVLFVFCCCCLRCNLCYYNPLLSLRFSFLFFFKSYCEYSVHGFEYV